MRSIGSECKQQAEENLEIRTFAGKQRVKVNKSKSKYMCLTDIETSKTSKITERQSVENRCV